MVRHFDINSSFGG